MEIGVTENSFTSVSVGDEFTADDVFDISVDFTTGSGVGTVVLKRSFDNGVTWKPGIVAEYATDTEERGRSPGIVKYRFECTAYTSGTIATRLSS